MNTNDLDRGQSADKSRQHPVSRAALGGSTDARSRERMDRPAATAEPVPTDTDRSGYHTFQRTGRYPLAADLGARCAAITAQLPTAAATARIRARGLVQARALRKAEKIFRKADR
jgi:hypothetical protein